MHESIAEPRWDFWNQYSSASLLRSRTTLKTKDNITERQEKILHIVEQILTSRGITY